MQNQCKTNAKPMQNHFQGHTGLMQNRLVFDLIQIDKNKKNTGNSNCLEVKLFKIDKFCFKKIPY